MSNQNDFNHIGDDIRRALDDAIKTMDFTKLNANISNTVNGALDEVRVQISRATSDFMDTASRTKESFNDKIKKPNEIYNRQAKKQEIVPVSIKQRPVGKVSSILYTVFGGIGTGVTGVLTIVYALIAIFTAGASGTVGLGISVFILLVSMGLLGTGSFQRSRLNRFKRYLQLCGGKTYCDIRQLAAHVGKSTKYVISDLKKMIRKGMLPEGHLDNKGTCLMLDDKTYQQYLETMDAYDAKIYVGSTGQEVYDGVEAAEQTEVVADTAVNSESQALEAMISEGQEYIDKLRELNDAIPGEIISEKLYRLEQVITEIFDALRKNPEKKPQMRKFMDYYLPTTLKLVQTYANFDEVQIQGDNILTAKQEIEKTLDTINQAFEKLLDDLFMDAAFDITTDAQVLQTILAQEGLAEDNNFKQAGNERGKQGGLGNEQ